MLFGVLVALALVALAFVARTLYKLFFFERPICK
jgi:ABC-type sulfate transport system permease component